MTIQMHSYDGLGRLVQANYSASAAVGGAAPDYSCQYAYDKASRPTEIRRYGLASVAEASGSLACEFGQVDDLSRDHQGSVRQVVSGIDGSVVQENQYYPYGALHGESSAQALSASSGASASPYKYGGKEHVSFANAHLLDFTARTYDPALALFLQPDPHHPETGRGMVLWQ